MARRQTNRRSRGQNRHRRRRPTRSRGARGARRSSYVPPDPRTEPFVFRAAPDAAEDDAAPGASIPQRT